MCDYSLELVKSRPAKVGDTLTTGELWPSYASVVATEEQRRGVRVTGNGAVLCTRGKVRVLSVRL